MKSLYLADLTRLLEKQKLGLLVRQLGVLTEARRQPGLSVRDLASGLLISKPAVTRAVDALVRASLAERAANPPNSDRRLVCIKLTPAGTKLLAAIDALQRQP